MVSIYKFGIAEPEEREWFYENEWTTEAMNGGGTRLVISAVRAQSEILAGLLQTMPEPFWVLYVLVVPRGHGEQGRYQTAKTQSSSAVTQFLREFSGFLEKDGRHNVWIASEAGSEMLIYDRHNIIYAYGALDHWKSILTAEGFREVSDIRFPAPHSHHYHQSLDVEEERLLKYWDWQRTALKGSEEE